MCRSFCILVDVKDRKNFEDITQSFFKKINKKRKLKAHLVQYTDWSDKQCKYKALSSAIDWIPDKYKKDKEKQRKHLGTVLTQIFKGHKGAVFVYETDTPYEQVSACGCEIAYFPGWSNKHKKDGLQPGWELRPYHLETDLVQLLRDTYAKFGILRFIYVYINSFMDPEYGLEKLKRLKLKPIMISVQGFKKSNTKFILHKDKLLLNQMYELKS